MLVKKWNVHLSVILACFVVISFISKSLIANTKGLLNIIILPILLIMYIRENQVIKDYKEVKCLYLIALFIFISGLFNYIGIGSVLQTFTLLFCIFYFSKLKPTKHDMYFLAISFSIVFLYYLININRLFDMFSVNYSSTINMNIVAYVMVFSSMFLNIFINTYFNSMSIIKKAIIFVLFLFSFIVIYKAEARGSLIAISVYFIFYYFIPKKVIFNRKNIKLFCIIVLLGGIFVPMIYVGMYENSIIIEFGNIEKSTYTGRELIWINFFKSLANSSDFFLFGSGSNGILPIGFNETVDMHNNLISNYTNFGFFVTFLYYYFHYIIIKGILYRNKSSSVFYLSIIAFLTTFIIGYFEATVRSPHTFILISIFLSMANINTIESRKININWR